MNNIELLSPVGSYESLIAAVQNGADAVYFGAKNFNARNFASNFEGNTLKKAIQYAKVRNVKTYLTVNTLIKNSEINEALDLINQAYCYGIDAIIIQDLGLAKIISKHFPDLPLHASTQMTVHNLEGVNQLEQLGFKRVVLARELSIDEISYICKNSNIEIEVFVHGALCVSYSGQCLLSSLIGQRSANRGKCAQACRLPYKLYNDNEFIKEGYLLNTKDLCTIEKIDKLKQAGITSLKIEGRMKTPEYVALVTSLYKKAILGNEITSTDTENLTQVFNRGGFATGHLFDKQDIIYPIKPKNSGIFLGEVLEYNKEDGLIKVLLQKDIVMGDGIETLNMECSTVISEILDENNNHIRKADNGQIVYLGKVKGTIPIGSMLYKTSSKTLNTQLQETFNEKEYKRVNISAKIYVKQNSPVKVVINDTVKYISDIIPDKSINLPLTKENIILQFNKTNNTPFTINEYDIDLDNNLFLSLSNINKIRTEAIEKYYNYVLSSISRKKLDRDVYINNRSNTKGKRERNNTKMNIFIYLNNIYDDIQTIQKVDGVYLPYRLFLDNKNIDNISNLSESQNLFISLPNITRQELMNDLKDISDLINKYDIKGIMISNYSQYELVKDLNIEIHGDYFLNVFNNGTYNFYKNLNIKNITISPELNISEINEFGDSSQVVCYGRIKCMTIQNCIVKDCKNCPNNTYKLEDRLGFIFPIITDNSNCTTNLYNSKILSFNPENIFSNNIRLDFFEESLNDIKLTISKFKTNNIPSGNDYTNGNYHKVI